MTQPSSKLSYEMYVAASQEAVWDALINAEVTPNYFYGAGIESNLSPGAQVSFVADGFCLLEDEIIDVEPQAKLSMTYRAKWDPDVAKDPPSRLTWTISPAGDTTKVSMVHEDIAEESSTFKQSASGWPIILSGLKTFLETGKPLKVG